MINPLSAAEKALARHALGLPSRSRQASRNGHFVARGSAAHVIWSEMAERQFARRYPGNHGDTFALTRAGADRALESGETLHPRHFPTLGQD